MRTLTIAALTLIILADNLGATDDKNKISTDSWVAGPMLKMIGAFEESTKAHPLIPIGTPDPYTPPK